jgi:pimeloyl-ACP methyl ester carboxylesterase
MLALNVRTYGDPGQPAIILLHGLFGSSANWGTVARHLGQKYRVLVPDLRNHGQSPHDPDCGYEAMVADVLHLLDVEAFNEATLVGHSMGGKVAMHLALNHPQRVSGLAVVDMSPVRYTHDFYDVVKGFRAVDLASIRNRSDADAQMAASVSFAGVRAFLLQNLVKRPDGWAWRLNIDALAAAQNEITGFPEQDADAVFTRPVSFIYGELSDYVTPAYEPEIRRLFPLATLCPVAQAGHWVYAEQPQGFMDCLDAYLGRLVNG